PWYRANARDLPWRRTRDPYAIWVSEIMLQQTQVKTVLPFWERWMREFPTIESAARARSEKIHKLWEGLGYYTRVRNLQKAARVIQREHNGKFPKRFEDILALPGIGRYTAGAIASIAFNQPAPILDGNVMRVLTRLFGITSNPHEKKTNHRLWRIAEELVLHSKQTFKNSRSPCSRLNQSLIELGALVCAPRNPRCGPCPVRRLCIARKTNRVNELPNLGKREQPTARTFAAFLIERNGHFLARRRPAGVVNSHLWEFPNVEIVSQNRNRPGTANGKHRNSFDRYAIAAKGLGVEFCDARPLCTVKHSITRYRMTLEAFRAQLKEAPENTDAVWVPRARLDSLPFTSAHRKVANRLLSRVGLAQRSGIVTD
ncbi:MAG: A/G-specific adenine glycosylase, partial [Limisphaerales bacterium]